MTLYFVTGGARSGKSRFAEQLAQHCAQEGRYPVTFVATGVAMDEEMAARIQRHQETRLASFGLVEAPHDVTGVISQSGRGEVYLVDCLSLLLNNWMFDLGYTESDFWKKSTELVEACVQTEAICIVVSNEIGLGIVPADRESRTYRDWLGWFNQDFAKRAERAYFVVSGIAVDLLQLPGSRVIDS